jgi:DNA (cytosine-5)-methyltransferase 1
LPDFPIYGDIREFDGRPWRRSVDILCGGFPCQDISAAGKGAGITGERSGLWKEYARIIGEIRPRFVFAENSPLLRTRGLGVVLEDLASLGYDARWGVLGAWHVGAPHKRDRMWVLAHPGSTRARSQRSASGNQVGGTCGEHVPPLRQADRKDGANRIDSASDGESDLANSMHPRFQGCSRESGTAAEREPVGHPAQCGDLWWHTDPAERSTEPFVGRVAHGVAHRVDRLKAIGNGQVPQCAAMAFRILSEGLI